jgi:hypothetical protein
MHATRVPRKVGVQASGYHIPSGVEKGGANVQTRVEELGYASQNHNHTYDEVDDSAVIQSPLAQSNLAILEYR